jgi:hypothetical protein
VVNSWREASVTGGATRGFRPIRYATRINAFEDPDAFLESVLGRGRLWIRPADARRVWEETHLSRRRYGASCDCGWIYELPNRQNKRKYCEPCADERRHGKPEHLRRTRCPTQPELVDAGHFTRVCLWCGSPIDNDAKAGTKFCNRGTGRCRQAFHRYLDSGGWMSVPDRDAPGGCIVYGQDTPARIAAANFRGIPAAPFPRCPVGARHYVEVG